MTAVVAQPRVPLRRACISCGQTKDSTEFHQYEYTTNQGKRSRRLDSRCKQCKNARRRTQRGKQGRHGADMCRRWRTAHPERNRRSAANWRANNPGKVNAWRASHPEELRIARRASECLRRRRGFVQNARAIRQAMEETLHLARVGDKYLDAYDGNLIDHPTIDHIEPVACGGAHTADNFCVTSRANNSSKHKAPFIVWLARRASRRDF